MNPILMANMSRLVYEPWDHVRNRLRAEGFPTVVVFDVRGTEAFLACRHDGCVLAFRGTQPGSVRDWISDVRFLPVDGPGNGRVHRGFLAAWRLISQQVVNCVRECVGVTPIYLTGHSLGAALATLAAAELVDEGVEVEGLCTFGSPRVGDPIFSHFVSKYAGEVRRFVNCTDVVTRVPRFLYCHVGAPEYFDAGGRLIKDPPPLYITFDRLRARWRERRLGRGIEDHSMESYRRLTHRALSFAHEERKAG